MRFAATAAVAAITGAVAVTAAIAQTACPPAPIPTPPVVVPPVPPKQPVPVFGPAGFYLVSQAKKIQYAPPSQDYMTACLPVPASGQWQGPYPAILLIHGGGWSGGTSDIGTGNYTGYSGSWCRMWASYGFAAFSVNYRLSGQAPWPAAFADVQAAVRYVRANAGALNVNPNGVGAEGDSAGGSLALQVGMTSTTLASDVSDASRDGNPKVNFVVDAFGPWSWGPGSATAPVPSGVAANLSPTDAANTAATLIIQGTKDTTVPPSQSVAAYCWMKSRNRPVHYVSYPGGHEYTGMSGPGWSAIVGNVQMQALSFAFAGRKYADPGQTPVIPATESGPHIVYDDPVLPKC